MENKVFNYITKEKMLKEGDKVVVGVSGGADSVCLLEILLKLKEKLKLEIVVVHIHHGIRGKDADADLSANFAMRTSLSFIRTNLMSLLWQKKTVFRRKKKDEI